jgi:hypothetical protein
MESYLSHPNGYTTIAESFCFAQDGERTDFDDNRGGNSLKEDLSIPILTLFNFRCTTPFSPKFSIGSGRESKRI